MASKKDSSEKTRPTGLNAPAFEGTSAQPQDPPDDTGPKSSGFLADGDGPLPGDKTQAPSK